MVLHEGPDVCDRSHSRHVLGFHINGVDTTQLAATDDRNAYVLQADERDKIKISADVFAWSDRL